MFKKLLSMLSSVAEKRQQEIRSDVPSSTPPANSQEGEMIKVTDAFAREYMISKQNWRTQVLGPNLKKHWNDPDQLFTQILSAINDGFFSDILTAANRLAEIDPNKARSANVLGFVLIKNDRLDQAERVLKAALSEVGRDGALLTTLAKAYHHRGEQAKSEEVLWEAVQADPNIDNSLMWWASIQRDRDGEQGYLAALMKVATIPTSWRAQLWIARERLKTKDVDGAIAIYQEVLAGKKYSAEALRMISGDLGNSGQARLIPDLIAPHFDATNGDLGAGFNLLESYLQLDRLDEGEALLTDLYQRNLPPYKSHLDKYSQAYQKKREAIPFNKPFDPTRVEPVSVPFSVPIWHYGLRSPEWCFRPKSKEAPVVGFLSFSKIMSEAATPEEQREDYTGRLGRAIPLYLAEAVHHWTERAATTLLQAIPGGGPVVYGGEADGKEIFKAMPTEWSHFVTGSLKSLVPGVAESEVEISLCLWNRTNGELIGRESLCVSKPEIGPTVLRLEGWLLGLLEETLNAPWDSLYTRPTPDMMNPYLDELGVLVILTFTANQLSTREAMWGERGMIELPLRMLLNWKNSKVCRLMFLSGLSHAKDYGSQILLEFKPQALELLREETKQNGILRNFAPLIYKTFSMDEESQKIREGQPILVGDAYARWLEQVSRS